MKYNFDSFVENVVNLFANWLFSNEKEWAWCPIKVDNRTDKY